MNYHLLQDGKDAGEFPLAELQRRREIGELAGTALVRREGMHEWQTLDSVLQSILPTIVEMRPPALTTIASARPRHRRWMLLAIAAVAMVGALVWVGMLAFTTTDTANSISGPRSKIITQSVLDSPGLDIACKPIASNTNALTLVEVRKQAAAYRARQWVEGYRQRGHRLPSYDADALRLLDFWTAQNSRSPSTNNTLTLEELSDKLTANPECDDPLVLTGAAVNCADPAESIRRLERAFDRFEKSGHRAYPKLFVAVALAGRMPADSARVKQLDASGLQFFRQALTDDTILAEDQPVFAEIVASEWGRPLFDRNSAALCEILRVAGQRYEWLKLVIEGEHYISESWKTRGSGTAETVMPGGFQGFAAQQAEARRCFTKAWELQPSWVRPAARMLYVALSSAGPDEMRQWFDRTLALQIDHPGAWIDMRWGLRPRWHGSLDAMRALGVAALDTRRFDTDVPAQFLKVVGDIESEERIPPGQHIYARDDIWPHLQRMYEGYIAEPGQGAERAAWQTSYAVAAVIAGKDNIARQQFESLNWQPLPEALAGWGYECSLLPWYIAAVTGEVGEEIRQAEEARDRFECEASLQQFTALSRSPKADARTRQFIDHRLASLPVEQRLKAGEWVDFLPARNDDLNWITTRGQWRRGDDGALEVTAGPAGHLLFSRVRLGAMFELKGEFEVVRSLTKSFQAGLVMGLPVPTGSEWFNFRMKRNDSEGDAVTFSRAGNQQQITRMISLDDKTNSFAFRMLGTFISVEVNGQEILRQPHGLKPANMPADEFMVGFGAMNDRNETVIRYRSVQSRILSPTKPGVVR